MVFQYKIEYLSKYLYKKDDLEYKMSELGAAGWELVSVDTQKDWYYFKKRID